MDHSDLRRAYARAIDAAADGTIASAEALLDAKDAFEAPEPLYRLWARVYAGEISIGELNRRTKVNCNRRSYK